MQVEHDGIELHMCGATDCRKMLLLGVREDGSLVFVTWTKCNLFGRNCTTHESHTGGSGHFTPGEVVLEMQRRPELTVWVKGRRDAVAKLPLGLDELRNALRVRPLSWGTDMPVEFTDNSSSDKIKTTSKPSPVSPTSTEPRNFEPNKILPSGPTSDAEAHAHHFGSPHAQQKIKIDVLKTTVMWLGVALIIVTVALLVLLLAVVSVWLGRRAAAPERDS